MWSLHRLMLSVFEPHFNWQSNIHNVFRRNPFFSFPFLLLEFLRILPLPPREMGIEQRSRKLHVPGIFQKFAYPAMVSGCQISWRQHILIGTEEHIHILWLDRLHATCRYGNQKAKWFNIKTIDRNLKLLWQITKNESAQCCSAVKHFSASIVQDEQVEKALRMNDALKMFENVMLPVNGLFMQQKAESFILFWNLVSVN